MQVRLYCNHNVNQAVTQGLRLRGVDVVTAFEDVAHRLSDPDLLDRATALGRVLVSSDLDLVVEARRRQRTGATFAGVIFMRQGLAVGLCIEELELLAGAVEAQEFLNSLMFLPLR